MLSLKVYTDVNRYFLYGLLFNDYKKLKMTDILTCRLTEKVPYRNNCAMVLLLNISFQTVAQG